MYGSDDTSRSHGNRHEEPTSRSPESYHPGAELSSFQYPVNRAPSYYHDFSRGPISAPAVPYNSEDYFSWTPEPTDSPNDAGSQAHGHEHRENQHQTVHVQHAPHESLSNRRYSGNIIRHRSNLSSSYVEEHSPGEHNSSGHASLFSRPDQVYSNESHSSDVKRSPRKDEFLAPKKPQKSKPSRKPGFFLKLDDLKPNHSPLHKLQHQLGATAGPLSDPNFAASYDKTEFFESDTVVESHAGDVSQPRGNITPLMFPPQTEESGYFGSIAPSSDSTNLEKDSIPGGYLNVTSKIHDPAGHSGTSGNNSDLESYMNFPVDHFETAQIFENNNYHNDFREYPEEVENTKAEAHFTPISGFHRDDEYHHTYDEHNAGSSNRSQHYEHDQHLSHDQNRSGHHYGQHHDYNNENSFEHELGHSVGGRSSNFDHDHRQHLSHHQSYDHGQDFQDHHYSLNQDHEYQRDTSHEHSGEHVYEEQSRVQHQPLHHEDSRRNNESHNYEHEQMYRNQDHGLEQANKYQHGHLDNSYMGSHHGQQHTSKHAEEHTYDLHAPHSKHKGEESYSENLQRSGSGYQGYSLDQHHSYRDTKTSFNSSVDEEKHAELFSVAQAVESSDTDQAGSAEKRAVVKKRKGVKGIVCSVCDKFIVRDFSRHMRIHDEAGRFQCCFPPGYCKHKSRKFNRPYDYKKHLLNVHFKFDDPAAKLLVNLTEKLHILGQCNACGQRFVANDWLEGHILVTDLSRKCLELQRMEEMYNTDQEGKGEYDA